MKYYVYTLAYPNDTVFYVGKGCGNRSERVGCIEPLHPEIPAFKMLDPSRSLTCGLWHLGFT